MISKLTSKNLYDIWSSEVECIKIFDFRPVDKFTKKRIPGAKSCIGTHLSRIREQFTSSLNISFFLIEPPDQLCALVDSDRDIDNVFEIEGGFNAWIKAGYPTAPLTFSSGEK